MHEIALPESEWWNELSENEEISKEATELLDGIINHFKNHTPGLTATPELIELAKKSFPDGVTLGGKNYEIVVYEPTDQNKIGRSFFTLIQKFPGGKLKHLSEC